MERWLGFARARNRALRFGALVSVLAFLPVGGAVVHAAPPKKKPAKVAPVPQSAEIAKTMGDLKWGLDREAVFNHFADAIKAKYKPLLAKAGGALEEDKLRAKMKEELAKLKSSEVDFNGKKTGYDVSFLRSEFTQRNGESMLSVSDPNSENYYFFIQDKLWKWYKAFKAEAFEGKNFDQFAQAIQDRFGASQKREAENPNGGGKQAWLEWQDSGTRLRAIDNSQFYGFYCLVFEDKQTLSKLPQLRTNKAADTSKGNALVDSVTSEEAVKGATDGNPDVMDRITGKIRHRQEAPAGTPVTSPSTGKRPAESAPLPPSGDTGGVTKEDDPLKGLGL